MTNASFPAAPTSVAAARRFVANELAECPEQLRDRAVLMVSELATNAVEHAHSGFTVSIESTMSGIRIELQDVGEGTPALRDPTPEDVSGRGLLIVQSLSDSWGFEERAGEKLVWFSLAT